MIKPNTKNPDAIAEPATQQSNQGRAQSLPQKRLPQWVVDHFHALWRNEIPKTIPPFPCTDKSLENNALQDFQKTTHQDA